MVRDPFDRSALRGEFLRQAVGPQELVRERLGRGRDLERLLIQIGGVPVSSEPLTITWSNVRQVRSSRQ